MKLEGMGMEVALDKLPVGIPAVVTSQQCSPLGLLPGTRVLICYRSPDRGVVAVEFGGTVIALQSKDLKGVRVSWHRR